jgi:hypothetical protein
VPPLPRRSSVSVQTETLSLTFYSDFESNQSEDDDEDEMIISDKTMAELRSRISAEITNRQGKTVSSDYDEIEDDDELVEELLLPQLDSTTSFSSIDELISFASAQSAAKVKAPSTEWAIPIDMADMSKLKPGTVLIANPSKFCTDFGGPEKSFFTQKRPSSALLTKFGLTAAPPAELGADRRSELLPVLILCDRHLLKGCQALLLNRRTGYLMGDLDQPQADPMNESNDTPKHRYEAFMIQPLWFGGTSSGEGGGIGGLDMIHRCPYVNGAKQLTEDGIFWGGDTLQAQDVLTEMHPNRIFTGFDFKFFVQGTRWLPTQLEKEIKDGVWFCASVSKEILFKSRDRSGQIKSKPLWTEIMELMGGEYQLIRDQLYNDEK